jgi:hypothetical protein
VKNNRYADIYQRLLGRISGQSESGYTATDERHQGADDAQYHPRGRPRRRAHGRSPADHTENDHPKHSIPVIQYNAGTYYKEKALVDSINAMPAEEKEALNERSKQYFSALKSGTGR